MKRAFSSICLHQKVYRILSSIYVCVALLIVHNGQAFAGVNDAELRIGVTLNAGVSTNIGTSERLAGVEVEWFYSGSSQGTFTTTFTGVQGTTYETVGTVPRNTPVTVCLDAPTGYEFNAPLINVGTPIADPDAEGRECHVYTLTSASAPSMSRVFDYEAPELRIGVTLNAGVSTNIGTSERLAGVEVEWFFSGSSQGTFTTTFTGVQGTTYETVGTIPRNTPVTVCLDAPTGYTFNAPLINVGTPIADPDVEGRDCHVYTLTSASAPSMSRVFDYEAPELRIGVTIEAGTSTNISSSERLAGVETEWYFYGESQGMFTTTLTGLQGTVYETVGFIPRNVPVTICLVPPIGYAFSEPLINIGSPIADPDAEDRDCHVYTLTSASAPSMSRVFDFIIFESGGFTVIPIPNGDVIVYPNQ